MDNDTNISRIEKVIEAIMKVAGGDYSVQIDISKEYDYVDALAIGFNMMVDDIRNSSLIEQENKKIKKLNEQLRIAKKAAEEAKKYADAANKAKSAFLANMSHEIRTPMNAVIGFSEILSDKLSDKPEYKHFLEGIINGGRNLISLINDILDLSKIEAGYLEIKKEPVKLLQLIEDIKQIFSVNTQKKGLQFLLEIDHSLPTFLMLDQTRIRQILFNLVGNAVKFTDTGNITVSVQTEGDIQPESEIDLYFEIKDTGIGIPKDKTLKIFEAFHQIKGQQPGFEGTGLGLPITKRLTEAMNGEITVESELGKGSIFRVHFKKVVVPSIELTKNFNKEISQVNIQFSNAEILLADDVKSNRDIVKYHLEARNCKVHEVKNGKEALAFLNTRQVDLVLMDIQMPVLNGYDATKQMKKQAGQASIPVIALTALAMKEQEKKYGDVFNDYLKKPISVNELVSCLMKYLPYSEAEQSLFPEKENDMVVTIEEFSKMPGAFREIFKHEILPLYEEVCDILDIKDCKTLARKLIETGKDFNIEIFVKYGTAILNSVENFQLDAIGHLLEEFGVVIRKLNV